jgi:alkylation response protein AidB-like acyl-CoA dehydrogenase
MTQPASPSPLAEAPGDELFRHRVRDALSLFGVDVLAQWERDGHIPRDAITELGRRGLFRERWAEGAKQGLPRLIAMSQEVCGRSSGLAMAMMGHSEIFTGALRWLADSPAQFALLDSALDGTVVGCFAATEPQGGSSLAAIQTAAVAVGDGWHLQGCKRYVSNVGGATHVLVLARPERARGSGDLALFVVPLDAPGVTVDGFFDAVGIHACDVGQVTLDADVPGEALLGQPGLGLLYASHLLQFERISICAQLLTSAERAIRLAAAFGRWRTIGESRLIDQQVIRHRLAACQAELWTLESRLRELVSWARERPGMPAHEIAALKLIVGESAERIVDSCIQMLGARGCSTNFPMERMWRDCRLARVGGGTDEVLAELVATGLSRDDPPFDEMLAGYLAADLPRAGSRRDREIRR